ncbi:MULTISPECIES: alpha-E domain-containing protein [unclassified Synechococcus]|uniref:alpha-E domain-containing protein n=1 Tax=unclassified Synechococcus TaxID=2626047 RepID=UPI000B998527|nr:MULTISPECIES: alpha-E domain-containing protein [unclassified Synechococcus]MBD2718169.1 alpha-E domain-containing protein [Synechococcus sp. FACHB-909]
MLSRVADSLYWINRNVERAENISRFVEVSEAMALDCPPGSAEPWLPLIEASGDRKLFDELYPVVTPDAVIHFLVREAKNPSSVLNCIANARENARQIREVMTTEMWEQINDIYWTLQEEAFWRQPPQEQLREIRRACQLFYGITDATLSRDLSWQFSRLGRLLERADKTTRILDVKYFLLLPSPEEVGGVLDELQWISLLRSAGAYQMFRQSSQQAIEPKAVAAFLLLDPIFPRSVRYCLERISDTLRIIRGSSVPRPADDLECLIGLTLAHWSFTRIDELVATGLHEAIDNFQSDLNRLHELIEARYFIAPAGTTASQEAACEPA